MAPDSKSAATTTTTTTTFALRCIVEGYGRYTVSLDDDDDDNDEYSSNSSQLGKTPAQPCTTWKDLLYKDVDNMNSSNQVSAAFAAMALALRYRSPIRLRMTTIRRRRRVGNAAVDDHDQHDHDDHETRTSLLLDEVTLRASFPAYQSADTAVLAPAARSADQIARGFTIHTLQSALRLALVRNDAAAAVRIRAELDRWDDESLASLPVQPDTDVTGMQ